MEGSIKISKLIKSISMKNLIFLFVLIANIAFGQTADYSKSVDYTKDNGKCLIYETYDTLSGTNDTLIISFPISFYGEYSFSVGVTWLSTGTTTSSSVFLQGRNASHETWQNLGQADFEAEVTTKYTSDATLGSVTQLRLLCVSASGVAHLKTSLVLKRT